MDDIAEQMRRASYLLRDAFDTTRPVWRDDTARHYERRYHDALTDALDRYARALDGLEEVLGRAESIARED